MRGARWQGTFPWIAPLVAGAAAVAAGPRISDDAYITLRYARSLANGEGFVYNAGEHVLGSTTPLLALGLGFFHWLTGLDLVALAFAAAVLGHMGVTALVARIGSRCQAPVVGGIAAGMYALAPLALAAATEGMETSLFIAATLVALMPGAGAGAEWRSVGAAVAALLRPEGLLTVGTHLLQAATAGRRAVRRATAIVLVALLPWLVFAVWYFGSPLPQSMTAKWTYHQYLPFGQAAEFFWFLVVAAPVSAPMIAMSPLGATTFGGMIAASVPLSIALGWRRGLVLGVGCIVLLLMSRGAWVLWHRNRQIGWLLLFACGYVAAYCVANPHVFPWYLVPPLPVVLLCLVAGVTPAGVTQRQHVIAGAVAVLLLVGAVSQAVHFVRTPLRGRETAYRRAVELLGPRAQDPNVLIGALEIGAVGYYSRARILDHYGLVSPQIIDLGQDGAVARFRPAYYIVQDVFSALTGLGKTPAFAEHYRLVGSVPTDGPQAPRVQLWQRMGE